MKHVVPYRPSRVSVFDDFDRLFDGFFNDRRASYRTPSVDIVEDDDRYVLEAELTGLSEKDVDVKVEDNLLTISSSSTEEKEEEKKSYLLRERKSYQFARSFVLPKDVNRENISATFKNGLLSLVLPKLPETKPRKIDIAFS